MNESEATGPVLKQGPIAALTDVSTAAAAMADRQDTPKDIMKIGS